MPPLLLTSAEKSIMTATAKSGRKLQSILLTEKWKLEEKDYVLLGISKQVVVNLHLGNVLFFLIFHYLAQSIKIPAFRCNMLGVSTGTVQRWGQVLHKQETHLSCTQTFCVIYCL